MQVRGLHHPQSVLRADAAVMLGRPLIHEGLDLRHQLFAVDCRGDIKVNVAIAHVPIANNVRGLVPQLLPEDVDQVVEAGHWNREVILVHRALLPQRERDSLSDLPKGGNLRPVLGDRPINGNPILQEALQERGELLVIVCLVRASSFDQRVELLRSQKGVTGTEVFDGELQAAAVKELKC